MTPVTWRIIPGLGYVVHKNGDHKSPKDRLVGPLPNGLSMAAILTTYVRNWDDPHKVWLENGDLEDCGKYEGEKNSDFPLKYPSWY